MRGSTPDGPQTPNPGLRATQRAQLAPVGIPHSRALACQRQPRDPPLAFSLASAYVPVEMVVPEVGGAGWAEPATVATNNARRRARPPHHNPRTRDTGHRRITTEYSVYWRTSPSKMSWDGMRRRAGRPAAEDSTESTEAERKKPGGTHAHSPHGLASLPGISSAVWHSESRRTSANFETGRTDTDYDRADPRRRNPRHMRKTGPRPSRGDGTDAVARHMRKTRPRPIRCNMIITTGRRILRGCREAAAGCARRSHLEWAPATARRRGARPLTLCK